MDIQALAYTAQSRKLVVIVLTQEDFRQLHRWARDLSFDKLGNDVRLAATDEDWDKGVRFIGIPVVRTEYGQSFVVEDTPSGPLIHYLR